MNDFRLKPIEPQIKLYEQGFTGVCRLGRAGEGKKLSDLVERLSEPMVIAIDAPWGAGKTVFLKCWVGAHGLENEGEANTVYFDAFRHDFMDDPLVGLTGAIAERIGAGNNKPKALLRAKEAVSKLARPAFRTGLAMATSGLTEITGAVVDAGLVSGSKELAEASRKFWLKEEGKIAAMRSFRTSLEELASVQKLVIVVDELDRCRPDYALNLLEVIKHFFDVHNVHFILGVNLKELANSVRARYGPAVEAERYLQKFVTLSMPLLPRSDRTATFEVQIRHFRRVSEDIGLSRLWKYNWIDAYLRLTDSHASLSLRDVERIATLAMVTPEPSSRAPAALHLYIGSIILQVLAPQMVQSARRGQLALDEFSSVFGMLQRKSGGLPNRDAGLVWSLVLRADEDIMTRDMDEAMSKLFEENQPRELLRNVISDCLDSFQLVE